MQSITIGQVAKRAGVGVETVRFYERQGLLAAPRRRPSGYRQYGDDVVERLEFIRRAKSLGFTLAEIKSLLSLRVDPNSTVADLKEQARRKLADVEAKIESLTTIRNALQALVKACRGSGPKSDCPILESLDPGHGRRHKQLEADHECH